MKGVLFPTVEEATPFLEAYKRGRFTEIAEGEFLHDDHIWVGVTGLGKIKGALRAERFLRQRKVDSIVHVGTCTALVEELPIGSLFAAEQVFEGDRVELSAPTYPRMPLATPFGGLTGGTLVTQDHTVQDAKELTYWQRIAEVSDTTGYAVAYVAATHGIGCSIVKVISGRAGHEDPNLRKTLTAAHRSIAKFLMDHVVPKD